MSVDWLESQDLFPTRVGKLHYQSSYTTYTCLVEIYFFGLSMQHYYTVKEFYVPIQNILVVYFRHTYLASSCSFCQTQSLGHVVNLCLLVGAQIPTPLFSMIININVPLPATPK